MFLPLNPNSNFYPGSNTYFAKSYLNKKGNLLLVHMPQKQYLNEAKMGTEVMS